MTALRNPNLKELKKIIKVSKYMDTSAAGQVPAISLGSGWVIGLSFGWVVGLGSDRVNSLGSGKVVGLGFGWVVSLSQAVSLGWVVGLGVISSGVIGPVVVSLG